MKRIEEYKELLKSRLSEYRYHHSLCVAESAVELAKRYGADICNAYDIGYARGWEDAYVIPKRVGAKTAAAYGYKKGVRNRRRTDKYIKQYENRGKRQ